MHFAIVQRCFMLQVEVVYIPEDGTVFQRQLHVAVGATVADALHQSGLFTHHPEAVDLPVGLFATVTPLSTVVKAGDRVEVYRPLRLDPKEKRRQRARVNSK
jgi:putative ubiquitin-RnfH superfamily antitoxin RatB of RatAB toxin-antitoxin module